MWDLTDFIVELEGIAKDLNQVIKELQGKNLLKPEREQLEQAIGCVKGALASFKRLKGLR